MKISRLFWFLGFPFSIFAQQENPKMEVRYDSVLKSYIISEVKVVGLSFESFKKEFLTMEVKRKPKIEMVIPPEPSIKIGNTKMPVRANPDTKRPEFHQNISGPITFFYNKFSKEAKDKKRTESFKKMTIFQERFFPATKQETHLSDDSVRLFTTALKPNIDSLMTLTEYELREYIREKFVLYKRGFGNLRF